jgi:hypothetical protein
MANRIMKRNFPSEAKIKCIRCIKQMKFRELRRHLAKVHDILNVSISCSKTLENRDTCDFHCSFSLDCFLEHSKSLHNNLFEKGANSIFDSSSGFNLLVSNTTGRIHTEVCQNAREKRRKEQIRVAKVKWSMKTAKRKATNTHAKVSDKGDIVVTETDEVEVVCEPVLTTEPAEIVTKNQQVAVIATTHHKISEDPVDVITIEDSDDEDDIDGIQDFINQDMDSDDDDIDGIQDFINQDMEEDDADAVEIDPDRAYNLKDAVEWMNANGGEDSFQRILLALGAGNKKLGERLVLKKVMAVTNISDREHTMLLINWQLEKKKGVKTGNNMK